MSLSYFFDWITKKKADPADNKDRELFVSILKDWGVSLWKSRINQRHMLKVPKK